MLEKTVEDKLKVLEDYGFEVLKLRTPGVNGVMDRMILAPTWSPAPPVLVEAKRPGKSERPLQEAKRDNWRKRGVDVRDMVDTPEAVQRLCDMLLWEAYRRYTDAHGNDYGLPKHVGLNAEAAIRRLCAL